MTAKSAVVLETLVGTTGLLVRGFAVAHSGSSNRKNNIPQLTRKGWWWHQKEDHANT